MKRRLDLAASLIHSPQVLFLDEPTTGLDPISRSRVWEYVRHVNRELGVSIFLTTHYLEEADALADRVGIINHGVLAAAGTSDQLKRSVGSDVIVASVSDARRAQRALVGLTPAMQTEAYEGELAISTTDGAGQISQIALALNRAGVTVTSLTLPTARLITYSCTLPVRECTTRPTTTQVNLPLRFPVERRCGRRLAGGRQTGRPMARSLLPGRTRCAIGHPRFRNAGDRVDRPGLFL